MDRRWLLAPVGIAAVLLALAYCCEESSGPAGHGGMASTSPLEIPQVDRTGGTDLRAAAPAPTALSIGAPALFVQRGRLGPVVSPSAMAQAVRAVSQRLHNVAVRTIWVRSGWTRRHDPTDPDIAPYDDADTPDRDFILPAPAPGERAR